jgi:hypothetical protein
VTVAVELSTLGTHFSVELEFNCSAFLSLPFWLQLILIVIFHSSLSSIFSTLTSSDWIFGDDFFGIELLRSGRLWTIQEDERLSFDWRRCCSLA